MSTISRAIVGTAAYMSPEQAEGREIDARSDIFSFGLVLYEMLCGQRAFRGDSWISTLTAILHDEPRPLRDIKADIPLSVEQCVARCNGLVALGIMPMTETAPLAKSAAQRALAIDPALAEAHSVLGLVAGSVEYDWKFAECHFQAAMAVEPVPPLVRVRYALYFLTPQRRFEEAIAQYQRALETDPLSMMVHFGLLLLTIVSVDTT